MFIEDYADSDGKADLGKMRSTGKIIAFCSWLALLFAVVGALYFQDDFFKNKNEKIAKIDNKSGDVMYREEGLVRWRDAVDEQEFSDGDWVATGPEATSTISFRSGQMLRLGPDTQIQIRSILQGSNDYSYMVTLSRGAVVAEVKKTPFSRPKIQDSAPLLSFLEKSKESVSNGPVSGASSAGMVVRSGNRSFSVDSGNQIGLVKESGQAEIKKTTKVDVLKNQFQGFSLPSTVGLKSNFLPPSARIFPEKVGSVLVAKEAILSHSPSTPQVSSVSAKVVSTDQKLSVGKNSLATNVAGTTLSPADLAILSTKLFSGQLEPSSRDNLGNARDTELSRNRPFNREKTRITDALPVTKIKDNIVNIGLPNNRLEDIEEAQLIAPTRGIPESKNASHAKNSRGGHSHKKDQVIRSSKKDPLPSGEISKVAAKGYEYFLAIPNRVLAVSAYRHVSSLKRGKVKVPLLAPINKPSVGDLRPIIELIGKNGSKIPLIEGKAPSESELIVPLDLVVNYGREKTVGLFKEYEVSARAGSVLTVNGERTESFERAYSVIRLRGYGEGLTKGLTVGLDRLGTGEAGTSDKEKKEIPAHTAPIRISIQSEQDLQRLEPFVKAANQVGVEKGGPRDDFGYFIVRKRSVVAEVGGPGLNRDVLQKVTTTLHGDFVFRGHKSALHESGNKSQSDIAGWIDSLLDQGKVLYVMKRARLYPVSRDFVKTNNEVAQFIDAQAKAVFVEKVEVLFFR